MRFPPADLEDAACPGEQAVCFLRTDPTWRYVFFSKSGKVLSILWTFPGVLFFTFSCTDLARLLLQKYVFSEGFGVRITARCRIFYRFKIVSEGKSRYRFGGRDPCGRWWKHHDEPGCLVE